MSFTSPQPITSRPLMTLPTAKQIHTTNAEATAPRTDCMQASVADSVINNGFSDEHATASKSHPTDNESGITRQSRSMNVIRTATKRIVATNRELNNDIFPIQ